MPAYCLEKLSYSCYKLRKKYNRNADIPITMAVLAGTSVLSVDTAAPQSPTSRQCSVT